MSRWNLAWLLGINAVALLGLAISYSAPPQEDNKKYARMRLLVDVLDEVEHKFVRKLTEDEMRELVENMINGGLGHLDPYSSYINSKKLREFNKHSKGKFGGVGIQIHADQHTGLIRVICPIVGTPAYDAGVQAGDLIIKIDGQSTENLTLEEAVDRISGEKGQPVVLTVLHEGEKKPVDLKMVRDIIEVESVLGDSRLPDRPKDWDFMYDKANKIAYVRLAAFNENSASELRDTIVRLKKQGMRGLVLDLRYNPGGLLTSAVHVSNIFLKEGSRVVSIRGRNHKETVHDAIKDWTVIDSATECPMAVLINRSSASASEIVAAALQDHKRAVVIGERSFGKGSVQNVIDLENHKSVLKLTTATYWRPSGKNIHRLDKNKESDEWGVKPNDSAIQVRPESLAVMACSPAAAGPMWPGLFLAPRKQWPSPFEVVLTDEERYDYQYYRYEKDLVPGKTAPKTKASEKPKKKKAFQDRVLERALQYLRGEIQENPAHPEPPKGVNS
jgi:carboxyl-terminal processing protease